MAKQDSNFLNLGNFSLVFPKLPDVQMKIQTAAVPGLSLGSADQPTPFVRIPRPGNLTYDDFNVTFLTSENLDGWYDIFDWMVRLGHPDDYTQHPSPGNMQSQGYDDITLTVRNSSSNPIADITFTNAFPIYLSPLNFDATASEPVYDISQATFRFSRFYIKRI